ncbi:FMN-linked oxidoreductase, partial [Pilatotrama ljubarskyi]
ACLTLNSSIVPTRLYALKHGAKLVWGPERVDRAILHTTRVVGSVTGVVSYHGKSKPIFTTHPIEKPFLIYQIGSADPDLAVQAAKMVMQDVSGFDLNCGCPKPDAPEMGISAKIRLLPSQEDTLKLVERIVNTGITALTAIIERLREIVEFVERIGRGIAVIANGYCLGYEDSKRVRAVTRECMLLRAVKPRLLTSYCRSTFCHDCDRGRGKSYMLLAKYLNNHWSSTKFCATQFQGAHEHASRNDLKMLREAIMRAKSYDDLEGFVAPWTGEQEWAEIVQAIEARAGQRAPPCPLEDISKIEYAPLPVRETKAAEGNAEEKPLGEDQEKVSLVSEQPQIPQAACLLGLDAPPRTTGAVDVAV